MCIFLDAVTAELSCCRCRCQSRFVGVSAPHDDKLYFSAPDPSRVCSYVFRVFVIVCVCVGVLMCFFMSMTRGSSPCHCVIPPPLTFFTASQSRSASCRSFTYPRTLESVQDHDLSSSCSSLLPSTICAQISPVIVNSSASSFFNRRLAHCQKSKKFSLSRWSSYSHRSLVVRIRRSARLRQQFFRSNRTNLPPFFISSNRSTSRSSRCPHPHSPTLYPPALS